MARATALVVTLLVLAMALLATRPAADEAAPVSHWVFDTSELRTGTIRDQSGRLPAQVTSEPVFAKSGGLETRPLPNGVILRDRSSFPAVALEFDDVLELVHFVGGG